MAQPELVPRTLPDEIRIDGAPRFTPNEIRALKVAAGGRPYGEVMNDEADAMQAMVWVTLRRQGFEPTWEQAGEVFFVMEGATPDPTNGERSTNGPHSVVSGE